MGVLVFRRPTSADDAVSWLTHYDVQGRGHGVVGAHGGEADAVGGALNKTDSLGNGRDAQRSAAPRRDSRAEAKSSGGIKPVSHCKAIPIFAREPDLPGWCRCGASRETALPPGSWGPRRRPPASSRPGRGWSRWTCHPLRHTPPWAGELGGKKIK